MFKGIKKRFNSSRSGRGRKGERSPPPGGDAPLDPPDRKSTSPRQVHPADLGVCGAPYARRSLERGGGGGGGGRHPKSPPISPTHTTTTTTTTPHIAYPTTPNLCVTAGKIEFITPPDSTLSSTASRCSTLKLSPTTHSGEEVCPRTSPTYSPTYNTAHTPSHNRPRHGNGTPPSTLSRSSGSSSSSSKDHAGKIYSVEIENEDVKGVNNLGPEGPYQLNQNIQRYNLNDSYGYNHNKMETTEKLPDNEKVEELRRENEEVKLRLSSLQNEFSQLENQVHVLMAERQEVESKLKSEQEAQEIAYASKLMQYQATIAALDQCATPLVEDPPVPTVLAEESQSKENLINRSNEFVQKLMDRCRTLEQANTRLQVEARAQQQQYEICLDRVATQVVQALLSQKSHQEQCIKLAHQVQDLRRQNATLSSLVGHSGAPQTLPCPHRHRCPLPSSPPSFLSLPASLTKNRQHHIVVVEDVFLARQLSNVPPFLAEKIYF